MPDRSEKLEAHMQAINQIITQAINLGQTMERAHSLEPVIAATGASSRR